tara:strand:+ start:211 stop:1296 length:1086 start_codon:yes stop_codon:yes gene_type:complete
MVKVHFDVEKSLKECNPNEYYSQKGIDGKPLFPGVKFIKRMVMNRDKVTFRLEDQIREEDAGENRVDNLELSYKGNGHLPNKIPQAIITDPNDSRRFLGAVGFGRNEAQDRLSWESAIYDWIEVDTPLNLEIFKINSNDDDDHLPAEPNSIATLKKSVVNAVDKNLIDPTDDDMLAYLKTIARRKSDSVLERIIKVIRKEDISRWPTMKAWSTARAKVEANRLELPVEGDKSKKSKSLGYARKFTTKKNFFWDGMTLSVKYGFQPVYLSTWVDEPKPTTLNTQRKAILDEFNEMEEMFNLWVSHYLDMPINEVREKSKGRFPLKFNGFFGQDKQPTTKKEGLSIESDLVDVNGKTWNRLDT